MHFCGRIVLAALGIRYRVEGAPPAGSTLVAANHLSYLDIVIVSAAMPAAFVAKQEIGSWPFFGPLSKMGGAIFVDRVQPRQRLGDGGRNDPAPRRNVPVVLFPEGTSTDGSEVLRFHSTLFAPAVEAERRLFPRQSSMK
jgi:1-acyl-sn-glycerol-3-phosphate acyltransferase